METGEIVEGLQRIAEVPTRLEGMETFRASLTAFTAPKFRPDLRGWKLKVSDDARNA